MGRGISAEAYSGERSRLQSEQAEEMAALQRGPTFKMLQENWQEQGAPGDMTTFYGGPAARKAKAEAASVAQETQSPRRGLQSGIEGQALLEREKSKWYYV